MVVCREERKDPLARAMPPPSKVCSQKSQEYLYGTVHTGLNAYPDGDGPGIYLSREIDLPSRESTVGSSSGRSENVLADGFGPLRSVRWAMRSYKRPCINTIYIFAHIYNISLIYTPSS